MRFIRASLATAALALFLAACGGGPEAPEFKTLVVFGDSLADIGTLGLKFTVQKSGDPKGYPIWTQLVGDAAGIPSSGQCSAYTLLGGGLIRSSNLGCTHYAIAGGRIVTGAEQGGPNSPLRVMTQMEAHASNGYDSSKLVLINGGGNDAADLVGMYLGAGSSTAGAAAYQAYLSQQLSEATMASLFSQSGGAERGAAAYFVALADTFYTGIKTHVLNRGATYVAVLNMPAITLTPRFKAVLAGVSASSGVMASVTLQAHIESWIKGFNERLAVLAANDPRILIIDLNSILTQQVTSPGTFALSNALDAACPVTGLDSSGLPSYTLATCTDAALNATAGRTPGWWKTWLFSDNFHPTPYGHQILADTVLRAIRAAAWI